MADTTKLIIQSLQQGREVKISQRDYLTLSEYADNKGLKLEVVKKEGLELTVKAAVS